MAGARTIVNETLRDHPDGVVLDDEQTTRLLAAYGIECWTERPVSDLRAAQKAGRELGWDVVLKATARHLRERPDLAHVWRNIDSAAEMRAAWESLHALITSTDDAGFVVQKNAPPGVPVALNSLEDPLFGPVVSFGIAGPAIELLQDRSYRIPPIGEHDAAAMVREIKSSPMLFGYRGSEVVDVAQVEQLILRVAQLQHDLPQVSTLDLPLVLAGAERSSVLRASVRIDPVARGRSDWFARRLPSQAGDTNPG